MYCSSMVKQPQQIGDRVHTPVQRGHPVQTRLETSLWMRCVVDMASDANMCAVLLELLLIMHHLQ